LAVLELEHFFLQFEGLPLLARALEIHPRPHILPHQGPNGEERMLALKVLLRRRSAVAPLWRDKSDSLGLTWIDLDWSALQLGLGHWEVIGTWELDIGTSAQQPVGFGSIYLD
jgi:hypothetical protein